MKASDLLNSSSSGYSSDEELTNGHGSSAAEKKQDRKRETQEDPGMALREDIVEDMFGECGTMLQDFHCAYDFKTLRHGRMYITSKYICFYSSWFGQTRLKLSYSSIQKCNKGFSAIFIPNAIILNDASTTYVFRNFKERDTCYNLIQQQIAPLQSPPITSGGDDKARESGRNQRTPSPAPRQPLRRHSTQGAERSRQSQLRLNDMPGRGQERGSTHPRSLTPSRLTLSTRQLQVQAAGASSVPSSPSGGTRRRRASSAELLNLISSPPKQLEDQREEAGAEGVGDQSLSLSECWLTRDAQERVAQAQALSEFVKGDGPQEEVTRTSEDLPVSVREFFEQFFGDSPSPEASLLAHHAARGDYEIEGMPWCDMKKDGLAHCMDRIVEFHSPLSLGFISGPSQVLTKKSQHATIFGEEGMVIDTVTTVDDAVPMGDCFQVEDRWVVTSAGPGKCSVSVRWRIVWHSFCVLKAFIDSKSKGDVSRFNVGWLIKIEQTLASQREAETATAPAPVGIAVEDRQRHRAKQERKEERATGPSRLDLVRSNIGAALRAATLIFLIYTVIFWAHTQVFYEDASFPLMRARPHAVLDELYAQWGRSNLLLHSVSTCQADLKAMLKESGVIEVGELSAAADSLVKALNAAVEGADSTAKALHSSLAEQCDLRLDK
ncbi:unnamed protein product [Chrysoparadoxa australica]